MSKKNTSAMTDYNKERSHKKEQAVIDAINKLKKKEDLFSLSEICKEAGCSRQYIYKNPTLLELVNKYRNVDTKKKVQTKDSKDVLILSLRAEITTLKKEISSLKNNENYKEKYENMKAENEKLKMQLEQAYKDNMNIDF